MGPRPANGRHLMFREYGPPDEFRPVSSAPLGAEPASFPLPPESKRRSARMPEADSIERDRLSEPEDHNVLADLFLGELGQVAARDAAMGLTPWAPRPPATDRADREGTVLGRSDQPPEVEPERRSVRRADSGVSQFNQNERDAVPSRSLTIEALVLGHLPVMGSAWAHQYARSRSRLNGGELDIAVVRCFDGHARVDLSARTQFGVEDIPGHVAKSVSHVVVFGDSPNEQALITSEHVGHVTLLCGADEAGIVDAYRTLKALSDARDWSSGCCRLGVAIMGAGGARAATAFARLRDSALRFLGITLDHAGQFDRIEGGPLMHTIGTIPFGVPIGGPGALLATLADAASKIGSAPAATEAVLRVDQGLRRPPPTETPAAEEDRRHELPSMSQDETSANPRSRPDSPCIADDLLAEGGDPAMSRHPSLIAAHFPHLTPLAVRCPFADDVELAIDSSGGLHVLAAAHTEAMADSTVCRITAVLGWTKANRSVLALTLPPGRGLDSARIPVGHFVTTQPAAHRTLLDSTLSVHVLAPVVKTVSSDWVVVALN